MKSVILPAYNRNIIRAMLGLKVEETEMPIPGENDIIIKTHAAPVNPSDIAFIQGVYNIVKPIPTVPGFEASGMVVNAGKNGSHLVGNKVSCFVQDDNSGTWSEFIIANIADVIELKDEMDMDQAACFTVNPFTAYAMFDIVLQRKSTAIIQNASGGQVANFIRRMADENGIKVIDIVRKEETASMLRSKGASYVIVETDEDFEEKLQDMCTKLQPTVAFDAVGGNLGGIMFNALSEDSELVVYGGLSGKGLSDLNVMDVIFDNKIVSGFNLMDWKSDIGKDEFERISLLLQDKFIAGDYVTEIGGTTSLENIVKGLRGYIADMSKGKLLVKP